MKKILTAVILVILSAAVYGQKTYTLTSPDGNLVAQVSVGDEITYRILHGTDVVLNNSAISMELETGKGFGIGSNLKNTKTRSVNQTIEAHFYKRRNIEDKFNELTLSFRDGFDLVLRAYDEAVAYRFVSTGKQDFTVKAEKATFNFGKDHTAYVPYVFGKHESIDSQYFNSFENLYTVTPLSGMNPDKIAFMPLLVDLGNGKKVCITESDLQSYPGMYLHNRNGSTSLEGNFAPYPSATEQGGHNQLQQLVTAREPYIAKCKAGAAFPWRIVIVSTDDTQLLDSDIVYKLASPNRLTDISWVKPGKVAWEWWNHWGISGVDFVAGVNNETYMAYIDFASANNIEYVILDEGWAVNLQADLFQVVPEIDLIKLSAYAASKNVGLILWAGYWAFDRDMERVCRHYSELGIKGFKIDFMDRDDQQMVEFHSRAAETAARYNMLVDFHGTYKPTGLHRTYPNVINYEGVHGLEQMKWNGMERDQVLYDVTMPFIRMVAGPVDYTQGAMRNATKRTMRGINDEPMSQGTRCRQLAEYVIFESPLNMLCDSPNNYIREQECTNFISAIPTVWDETVAIDGKVGEHITVARCKDGIWYVGSLTNWDARTIETDLSFLGQGDFVAELYRDGANAHRIASDYRKETLPVPANRKLSIPMAPGGGYAMKIYRK